MFFCLSVSSCASARGDMMSKRSVERAKAVIDSETASAEAVLFLVELAGRVRGYEAREDLGALLAGIGSTERRAIHDAITGDGAWVAAFERELGPVAVLL